jgi:hypothetical protein
MGLGRAIAVVPHNDGALAVALAIRRMSSTGDVKIPIVVP